MVHAFGPGTWGAEAGGSLGLRVVPVLQNRFRDSQGCAERPCLEKQNILGSPVAYLLSTGLLFLPQEEMAEHVINACSSLCHQTTVTISFFKIVHD